MYSIALIALTALPIYWIYSNIAGLRKNLAAAKRSGLPYVVVPIFHYNTFWLTTNMLWLPLLRRLPKSWTEDWIDFLQPDWCWTLLYEPFKKYGDVVIAVSPAKNFVYVTNAEAVTQITSKREAFPKPLESYGLLDVFGRNMVSTEGVEWRKHRKVSSPSFNEKNNALVFSESCTQAQGMLRKWTGVNGEGNITLGEELPHDTMRLALHIISRIGFGVRLLWPGEQSTEKQSTSDAVYSSNEASEGYTMSFEGSLSVLLENLFFVLLLPKWLLKRLPFKNAKKAYESCINWEKYMNDLFAQKVEEALQGKETEGMDIMGSLVRSSYSPKDTQKTSGGVEKGEITEPVLSDSDIFGNCFVIFLAGHETTANSIHFSVVELAKSARHQRQFQAEVQRIFGDSDPTTWDYDSKINTLLGGFVGAVMNEQLRLMPPAVNIPKSVTKGQDQVITIDGKKFTLPAGAEMGLNTIGLHRNPKYWPTQPSKLTGEEDDLDDFNPERWLLKRVEGMKQAEVSAESSEDEYGCATGRATSAELYRPVRGSYIPFSDGARSCLGRRLAQIEVSACLAVIFQKYSVELAVDEWASDEEVAKMSEEEKKALYQKASDKAQEIMRGATSVITLKVHSGNIPVRLVPKGEERFINLLD